jgi:hypothetical protein
MHREILEHFQLPFGTDPLATSISQLHIEQLTLLMLNNDVANKA